MNDWLQTLFHRLESEPAIVRVIVVATHGSVPREAGACMLVGQSKTEGTIGGGHLEWKAEAIAHDMLANAQTSNRRLDRFTLGATLGQCCGGVVELWFERFDAGERDALKTLCRKRDAGQAEFLMTPLERNERQGLARTAVPVDAVCLTRHDAPHALLLRDNGHVYLIENILPAATPLWLYGAGHVGRALVNVLTDAPVRITWIDSRTDLFPAQMPANVTIRISEQPADEIVDAPAHALHLVMTHRHDFDYAICRALLKHECFQWAGMIGSETKAASFRGRLLREGFMVDAIARIVSPIGIAGIKSKQPASIAISAAAQVLQVMEGIQSNQPGRARFKESAA